MLSTTQTTICDPNLQPCDPTKIAANMIEDLKVTSVSGYSATEAKIDVVLSGDAYCGKDSYLTRTWTGPAKGFVATHVLSDTTHDT